MSNRVEKLRIWLVGSAVFLVLVIAAFMGSARYLRRHYLAGLPGRLGINIVRETNGYTYSQSVQGRTVYRIHAAKAVEHTNGKIALHDVSIILYGKKGDRSDRIYGDEFEYDQKAGVVRATGLVHIDMQTAKAAPAPAGKVDPSGAKVMHVTTSGLVYVQKLGVAATSENIEFEAGGITGHARGADYSSDSGLLTLRSAVNLSGVSGGRPLAMTAATAQFDDRNQVANLTHATYESEGRKAAANQATLHRRPDGTLSRVEAQGDVTAELKGAMVSSARADITLGPTSQPQTALLTGAVKYTSDRPLRQVKAQAEQATIMFDGLAKPQPQHAVFTGAVHMSERTRSTEAAKEPWSTRELTAAKFEAALEPGAAGRSELRDATATGNAHLTLVNSGSLSSSRGAGTTELSADDLKAHLLASSDAKQPPQLDTIEGRGHTLLHQVTTDGIDQTSAGDSLNAKFRPKAASIVATRTPAAFPANSQFAETLLSEVQQGHVTMVRRGPARTQAKAGGASKAAGQPAADDVEHAIAQRAAYDGDLDRMTLTGGVQLADAGKALWADQVVLDHKTGDAHAVGAVKMNYFDDTGSPSARAVRTSSSQARMAGMVGGSPRGVQAEPTHILADRAELEHATEIATFYGRPARLWQGGNQVQAPVIEFSKSQKRLVARGDATTGSTAVQVHTVLAAAGIDGSAATGVRKPGTGVGGCDAKATAKSGSSATGTDSRTPGAVRVASGGLTYSDLLRQVDFTGGFAADTTDGTIRAAAGTVYLRKAAGTAGADATSNEASASGGSAALSLAGGVDRMVATGHVELEKPGMKATGDRLVYTASDRVALLTGTKDAPPKAVDAQGTTTGAALRFQSSCDGSGGGTVEVLGSPGQRVSTDAQISDDRKKEKGKR
jgi:lipopolysaccharide export system protein LptA